MNDDVKIPNLGDTEHNVAVDPEDSAIPEIPSEAPVEAPRQTISSTSSTKPTPGLSVQRATDGVLHFLSHASNEMLGACFVGLGATTYMLLGRVGLLAMGLVGGVVLHATWEGTRSDGANEDAANRIREMKRETAIEVAKRLLDQREQFNNSETSTVTKILASEGRDFSDFEPQTKAALTAFTDAVIKDYVHYWYAPTLPGEESFPTACRHTLTAFILSVSTHLQRKRPADAFLDFATNASSLVIVFLNELSAALHASPNSLPEDAIPAYLRLKPDSSLSYMLNRQSQSTKLAYAAEDILQAYLDPKSYNCQPVHVFLKEVLAQLILGYTIETCSKPEWINEWIVYGLEESETTKEVMDIVDAGVEGRTREGIAEVTTTSRSAAGNAEQTPVVKTTTEVPAAGHKRQMSRAEEAMDEAMKEARRLTQLMMEEDERRIREEQEKSMIAQSTGDISDVTTQGIPTPSSSQSDPDPQDENHPPSKRMSSDNDAQTTGTPDSEGTADSKTQFTNFDQLSPTQSPPIHQGRALPIALPDAASRAPLTLHNANVVLFDDSVPGERTSMKAKPTTDYLIQIEPATAGYPGWMIARKYSDFEMLHEVLRRISVITGVPEFTSSHAELPKWKGNTKAALRTDLEKYLVDAVRYQPLAESEGMKRFLDKDQALSKSPGQGKGFGWPTPDAFGKLGGDVMNVLTKAPKQVAGGGKAVFGGVAGLVGGVGSNKKAVNPSQSSLPRLESESSLSIDSSVLQQSRRSSGQASIQESPLSALQASPIRVSQESFRSGPRNSTNASETTAGLPVQSSSKDKISSEEHRPELPPRKSMTGSVEITSPEQSVEHETYQLPPRPDEIPDDFDSPVSSRDARYSRDLPNPSDEVTFSIPELPEVGIAPALPARPVPSAQKSHGATKSKPPISDSETTVAIELMFAVITELYTLSSAWNIRRTFLAAAKTFLLRPGNPQLTMIRGLLQDSLLDSNLDDAGMAGHIAKMRANALPTEDELAAWKRDYPEKTEEEKEQLRKKARHLLVTKGMPQALTSVMGAAASSEALGKVFDCLQMPDVSRGLIFGLLLQAVKIITH